MANTTKSSTKSRAIENDTAPVSAEENATNYFKNVDNAAPVVIVPPQGPLPWTQAAPAMFSAYDESGKPPVIETAAIGPAPTTVAAGAEGKPEGMADLSVTLSDTDRLRAEAGRPPVTPETVSGYGEKVSADKAAQAASDDAEGSIKAPVPAAAEAA